MRLKSTEKVKVWDYAEITAGITLSQCFIFCMQNFSKAVQSTIERHKKKRGETRTMTLYREGKPYRNRFHNHPFSTGDFSLSGLAPSLWSLCHRTASGVIESQTGTSIHLLPVCTRAQALQNLGRESDLGQSAGSLHLNPAPSPTLFKDSASPYLAHTVCT